MPLSAVGQRSDVLTAASASRKVSLEDYVIENGSHDKQRTYEQITRSQSHSVTPTPPSKRRRTSARTASPSPSFTSTSSFSQPSSPVQRFAGDGLDYRRPTLSAMAQVLIEEQNTIDLTLSDDESDSQSLTLPALARRSITRTRGDTVSGPSSRRSSRAGTRSRLTQPVQRPQRQTENPVVIELSSEGETEDDDIQFTGFRQLTRGSAPSSQNNNGPRQLSTPPAELRRADAQTFGLARTAQDIRNGLGQLGAFIGGRMLPYPRPISGANLDHHVIQHGVPPDIDLATFDSMGEDYDIELDYALTGFAMDPGADDIEETKPPVPEARKGFTRDLEENGDVLVCVACEDELSAGKDELKQQVWVAKKCGHVSLVHLLPHVLTILGLLRNMCFSTVEKE